MKSEELTNIDVALYALYLLGGTTRKVFTEEIAKKSFDLSPSRFSWRRYPEYPDTEPVRMALVNARVKFLVKGRVGDVTGLKPFDGWIFSPEGVKWIEKSKSRIAKSLNINQKPVIRTDISKKLTVLESTIAFKKFIKDRKFNNIKPYEFTDFLNASLDTPPTILRDRIDKASVLAAAGKKKELLKFIEKGKKYFSTLLKYE